MSATREAGSRARRAASIKVALAAVIALIVAGGCVRRTITITSEPPGALCWLNGREVGRTPVTVDFLYYGNYDVQLTHDGYEPLLTAGEAKSPWWDILPLDLAAEAVPGEPRADIRWHYAMQPRESDRPALIDRAQQLREKLLSEAPAPLAATAPATAPDAATTPQSEPATAPTSQPDEGGAATSPAATQEHP